MKLSSLIAPIYKEFFWDWKHQLAVLYGGRSSAKGDAAYTKVCYRLSQQLGQAIVYVPLDNTIKEGVLLQVEMVLERMNIEYKTSNKTIQLANGSRIVFKGLSFENKKRKAEAFKGATSKLPLFAVIFDELAALEDPSRMFTIMATHGRQVEQTICIYNPPKNRNSWLFTWTAQQELDPESTTLKTTVYDLPREWDAVQKSIKLAESLKALSYQDWLHEYMGEPVGEEGLALSNPERMLISFDDIPKTLERDFVVFSDVGNRDATVFQMWMITPKMLILLSTLYYDGRENRSIPHSKQVTLMEEWIASTQIPIREVWADNLNMTLELDARGYDAVNISDKPRDQVLSNFQDALDENFIRILDAPDNQITLKQLSNMEVEEVVRNGRPVKVVKKVDNRFAEQDKQIHAADTAMYLAYYKYKYNKFTEENYDR